MALSVPNHKTSALGRGFSSAVGTNIFLAAHATHLYFSFSFRSPVFLNQTVYIEKSLSVSLVTHHAFPWRSATANHGCPVQERRRSYRR
jgi:hypothetical protein